jgi:hypothetical protein
MMGRFAVIVAMRVDVARSMDDTDVELGLLQVDVDVIAQKHDDVAFINTYF